MQREVEKGEGGWVPNMVRSEAKDWECALMQKGHIMCGGGYEYVEARYISKLSKKANKDERLQQVLDTTAKV